MSRENIVLIVVDDPTYDTFAQMSYLESNPDGRWAKFTRAVINYPVCGVSRASILSGRRQANLGGLYYHGQAGDAAVSGTVAHWDTDTASTNLFPSWLHKAGYRVGLVGKYLNLYPFGKGDAYIPAGWSKWNGWLDDQDVSGHSAHTGPKHFNHWMTFDGTALLWTTTDSWTTTGADATGRVAQTAYSTDRLNMQAREFVTSSKEPFCLYVATHAVKEDGSGDAASRHAAQGFTVTRPPSFNEADVSDKPAWLRAAYPTQADGATESGWDALHLKKFRMAQAIDELIRDVISTLKTKGVFDRTVIMVTTENSNLLGQHRLEAKGLPYEDSITAPLYVRHPAVSVGNVTSTALVQTFDLAPTLLEIADASRSHTRSMDGMSFLPLLDGRMTEPQWRQASISEWVNNTSVSALIPTWKAVRTHTHKYIEWSALGAHPAETELYDLNADPDELVNQTNNGALAATKADLASRLLTMSA